MALYNKYRPERLEDFIGNDAVTEALSKIIKDEDGAPSVYIFTGESGIGKTTLARILSKSFNCLRLDISDKVPCLECRGCMHPIIELDAGSMNIDSIREILEESKLYPMGNIRNRVYIIDEVHQLSTVAFGAMLKTLEEAPKTSKFILCTTVRSKIPATIYSRGIAFNLQAPSRDHLIKLLHRVIKQEGFFIIDDAINKLSRFTNVRQMLSSLEILSSLSEENQNAYLRTIGSINYEIWSDIISGKCTVQKLIDITESATNYYSYCCATQAFLRKQMGHFNIKDIHNIKLIRTFSYINNLVGKGNTITPEQFASTIFRIGAVNMVDNDQKHSEMLFNLYRWGYFDLAAKYREYIEDIYIAADDTIIHPDPKFCNDINIIISEIKKYEI